MNRMIPGLTHGLVVRWRAGLYAEKFSAFCVLTDMIRSDSFGRSEFSPFKNRTNGEKRRNRRFSILIIARYIS